ncbi:hypothetical protein [Agromyces archimandritae]|uniref:Uncharacterized protein n=1 Tax=Agromyces archimandritae TaxID=2781962 RepID=A0A975IPY8_9MICO|nr:hypothetical protein [Agromyces archimandritae]QTX05794.1 hypothetical protein G127AT_06210 [Agromyces archimandritae]
MSKRAAWVFESAVTALVVLGLVYVANVRYARPLVDPAPPPPDYALQEVIAFIGAGIVSILAVLLTLLLTRRPRPRFSSVLGVAAIIAACGIGVAVVAFVVPTA